MDGHHLVAQGPAGEWFEVEGGRYQLWDHAPPPTLAPGPPIATYEWIAAPPP